MQRVPILRPLPLLAIVAAPAILAGCAKTATYGTGEVPEMAIVREMTGGLVGKNEKQRIDYEPRAPLVIPAKGGALPAPVETASAASPDWPVDPDLHKPADAGDGDDIPENDVSYEDHQRLKGLAGLFRRGGSGTGTRVQNNDLQAQRDEYYDFVRQSQGQHDEFGKALADANGLGRTERRYLTDPPVAYRQPAATAPTEFKGEGKRVGFFRRLFPGG